MKANVAPEKIYLQPSEIKRLPYQNIFCVRPLADNSIEYTRTDAFIEKAAEFLYNYNQKQVLKHGARATLGCGEYTINVDEFRNYMKGE